MRTLLLAILVLAGCGHRGESAGYGGGGGGGGYGGINDWIQDNQDQQRARQDFYRADEQRRAAADVDHRLRNLEYQRWTPPPSYTLPPIRSNPAPVSPGRRYPPRDPGMGFGDGK